MQPLADSEENALKKQSVWDNASLVYLLLIQALIAAVCVLSIPEQFRYADELSFMGNNTISSKAINLLIEGKLLLTIPGLLAPIVAVIVKRKVGWLLVATLYYTLLLLGGYGVLKTDSSDIVVCYLLPAFTLAVLAVVCVNKKTARLFYKLPLQHNMIWLNLIALVFGAVCTAFLLHNYHQQF